MELGPAGYGRYDDDPEAVGCPRARSARSRCVARDGREALDPAPAGEDLLCHGCAHELLELIEELAGSYPPAAGLDVLGDQEALADEFALTVREATEPRER
ncbi:MAG TPA: hypothetical protein VNH17_02100 [Streptosporangiaceae bacterium]|jgi:hypothetical protein|nr:hypothetical protein [Streptosporangiaceae bacterium]